VVHPSNVIAYSMMQNPPQPYRFKANVQRFQVPSLTAWLPDTRFWQTMRESTLWTFVRNASFTVRTWARRTIWGDRVSSDLRLHDLLDLLTLIPALPTLQRPSDNPHSVPWRCSQ